MIRASNILTAVCAFTLALACASWPRVAQANEFARPTTFAAYGKQAVHRDYVFVPGGEVVFANYDRLRADWQSARGLSNNEIDQQLVSHFSYISRLQLRLRGIRTNSFAYDDTKVKTFLQPYGWNRAAVETASSAGDLVDVKGSGQGSEDSTNRQVQDFEQLQHRPNVPAELDRIRTSDHSDGLMTLGEALAETTRQLAVQRLFDRTNAAERTGLQTVETYFVISLPIDILKDGNRTERAALYGRQANFGRQSGLEVPYGLYLDNNGGMQSTNLETAVDFGGVQITNKDYETTFGRPHKSPQEANAWVYAHQTAKAYVEHSDAGRKAEARQFVEAHIETMIAPVPATKPAPTAELDYYIARLKSEASGVMSARWLIRHASSNEIEKALSETTAAGFANFFLASAQAHEDPAVTRERIPVLIDKIDAASRFDAADLLRKVLRVREPLSRWVLERALTHATADVFIGAFTRTQANPDLPVYVVEDLLSLATKPSRDQQTALNAFTNGGLYRNETRLLPERLDSNVLDALARSNHRSVAAWATEMKSSKLSVCRDLFALAKGTKP